MAPHINVCRGRFDWDYFRGGHAAGLGQAGEELPRTLAEEQLGL
jgi:hypothetical protein